MSGPEESRQLFEALLSAATDAIIVADREGRIITANPSAYEVFGYDRGTLAGRSVSVLMPPEMSERHDGFMAEYLRTGKAGIIGFGRDLVGLREDGTRFPLHLTLGHTAIGTEDFFVAFLHDLTSRRKIEAALERSQRMEALGQLTGGVAHDFNNLLTLITGNLELLENKATDADTAEILTDALEAAEVGIALTGQLLSFARRGVLMPEEVDADQVIDEMSGILRRTLGDDIAMVVEPSKALWRIRVDRTQLSTAILNLAINARAAMSQGGVLAITTQNVSIDDAYMAQEIDIAKGDYMRLSVSDTGEGMSEITKRQAFDPFFTTKPETQGAGLGLSLVYGFVRQSGGHVTLYSEIGQGSTFSLYFPRFDPGEETSEITDEVEEPVSEPLGQRVLIVEDNPAILSLSIKRLEALGYPTEVATNADDALAVLGENPDVSLLFSDIMVPGSLTGYDLALLVRKQFPQVGVLLTTAYSGELLDQNGGLQTQFEMLRKPYRQKDLARALRRVSSRVKARPGRT